LVPRADVIGALLNPNRPNPDVQLKDVQAAAQTAGRRLVALNAATECEVEAAFSALALQPAIADNLDL
jgi:putative tryptophan/tyrosine transport system substrate-binding protein